MDGVAIRLALSSSLAGEIGSLEIPGSPEHVGRWWMWAVIGKEKDCPMALRLAGQVAMKKGSFHEFYGVGRLPGSGLAAVGISFRPGPVGLRDSGMLGPGRGGKQTPLALSVISFRRYGSLRRPSRLCLTVKRRD